MLTKGLIEDLINKYDIINGAKYFSFDGLQNYLVFMSTRASFEYVNTNDNSDYYNKIELWKLHFLQRWLIYLLVLVEWNLKESV